MATNVSTWLGTALPTTQATTTWLANQAGCQKYFLERDYAVQDEMTRRVYKKMVARVGKFVWGQSEPAPAKSGKFALWNKTRRGDTSERTVQMNCWEMVLYGLFQADGVGAAKLARYYNKAPASTSADYDAKQRPLFGTQTPWNGLSLPGPNPGDIVTFDSAATGMLNHMGMYAGRLAGIHYILHLLSLDYATTGMGGVGMLHFERVTTTIGRYAGGGGCTAYYTKPFWVTNSPTNAYFASI
jgi:hypothetical protein